MGILDNFLGDIQKEIRRASDSVEMVKSDARKVVEIIDSAEEKLNNLPTEEELKNKLKQELAVNKNVTKQESR